MDRHMLDVDGAVLVVVDVQDRLAATMSEKDTVVATISRLVRVATVLGIPVLFTQQYTRGLGETVAELSSVLDEAVGPIEKLTFDCCSEPAFVSALEGTGRHQVVIVGMEAHICVTQTALRLIGDDYHVQVPADAVCSARVSDKDVALARLRAAGIEVTTSESVIYEAVGAAGTEAFRRVLGIVKEKADAG